MKKIFVGIGILVVAFFSLTRFLSTENTTQYSSVTPSSTPSVVLGTTDGETVHKQLPVQFFEENSFEQSLMGLSDESDHRKIYGGVVPHHLLASSLISDFFHRIKDQGVKKIILIGPNHYELGSTPILTSFVDWETQFGTVRSDKSFVQKSFSHSFLSTSDEIMQNEHSIGGILPFVKYFIPDATIIPFIIRANLSSQERKEFIELLLSEIDDETIVVASIDFSHYLTVEESIVKDKITHEAILTNNLTQISTMNSDYLDSPASLMVMLEMMSELGRKVEILNHTNAGDISGKYWQPTTSYFELAFY